MTGLEIISFSVASPHTSLANMGSNHSKKIAFGGIFLQGDELGEIFFAYCNGMKLIVTLLSPYELISKEYPHHPPQEEPFFFTYNNLKHNRRKKTIFMRPTHFIITILSTKYSYEFVFKERKAPQSTLYKR